MNSEWLRDFKPLTAQFMEYGWFVAPFLIGAEFAVVRAAANDISRLPSATIVDRKQIETKIYHALAEPAFSPGYRARGTWYGNQLNHLKQFNHLYEAAIFSYYKREYPQTVLCLLSAMEGVMLSFYGYDINAGATKPSIPELIRKIEQTQSPFPTGPMREGHEMYRDTLAKFLSDWIYRNTSRSDFSLSVLNRHYVLHGMEAGNFYRPQDVHRLIFAFDLIIEFLSLQQGVFHVFLPDPGRDAFIDARRDYYWALANGLPTVAATWQIERGLLRQHSHYVPPDHDPNIEESNKRARELIAELMQLRDKVSKTASGKPPPASPN